MNYNKGRDKNKNFILIMAIVLIIVLVGGGTMAWLSWRSENNTAVSIVVTGGVLTIDGGGDITSGIMAPTTKCNHDTYSIQRTITATAVNGSNTNMMAYIQLYTNSSLFPNVYKMENLEWVISSSATDCSTSSNILASGNFLDIDNSSDNSKKENTPLDLISFPVRLGKTVNKTYYLYIWINEDYVEENVGETVTESIQDKMFTLELTGKLTNDPSIVNELSEFPGPVLDDGMIPVVISNDGTVTTILGDDPNWYDYDNQEWANVVLVNDGSRSSYLNTSGVTVNASDILAYYVWIPRYKYKIWTTGVSGTGSEQSIDIVFESEDAPMTLGTQIGEYRTHPAFWWDDNSDGNVDDDETIAGIWVGKFETTGNATTPTILPSVESLRSQNVSTQFTASQKFSSSSNVYGLSNINTDSHMMKNSEWGAVAYLSHSKYGINDEIRINNNSNYITGCGALSENGEATSVCEITYNSELTPQSTTGNITGIFDMSGGGNEYVMGVLADSDGNPRSGYDSSSNSGFIGLLGGGSSYTSGVKFPTSKYYDLYDSEDFLTACGGNICYGHALSEVASWYGDSINFVSLNNPWSLRGGYHSNGVESGVFRLDANYGNSNSSYSWRSVLVSRNMYKVNFDLNYTIDYNSAKEHVFTVPYSGVYQLEVWGAQGGDRGGYGGYAKGSINLNSNEKLYVNVGGKGNSINSWGQVAGGYNGGGTAFGVKYKVSGSGGGATHIAKVSGVLSTLSSSRDNILIVAGGGGGGYSEDGTYYGQGGHGGGISGTNGYLRTSFSSTGPGGTQTKAGGTGGFGYGASATEEDYFGGGGGFYGGALGNYTGAAGGGSGYIGNSLLTDKEMYCYSCTTSNAVNTLTYSTTNVSETATSKYAKTGNGSARISLINSYKIVKYGSTYGELPILSKDGYAFAGWYTEPEGGTKITGDTIVSTNYEHTLYPVWKIDKYTIKYDVNGGNETVESQVKTYDVDIVLSDSILTRNDYIFVGWSTNKDATSAMYAPGDTYSKDEDVTLYAVWRPTILYLFNKGDQNADITGGWITSSGYSTFTINTTINGAYFKLSASMGGNAHTTNKIDLTHYNTIKVHFVSYEGTQTLTVTETDYDHRIKTVYRDGDYITADISDLQGEYYIYLYNGPQTGEFKADQIWLE